MTAATLCAGLAGALSVVAAWEAIAAVEQVAVLEAIGRALAPVRALAGAGREPTPPERRRMAAVWTLAGLAAGWLLAGPVVGLALAALGPWAVRRAIGARRARWRRGLAAGAPVVARSLADALAGGHAVRGALIEVARAGGAGREADAGLRDVAAALELGEPTDAVLERLRRRAADPAWDTLVAAIGLQRHAGGDLAGLLRDLAADLEAGRRALGDARAATAQARATAGLVTALPAGAAVLAELAHPGSLRAMVSQPLAGLLVATAAGLQLAALVAVRRLTRLDGP